MGGSTNKNLENEKINVRLTENPVRDWAAGAKKGATVIMNKKESNVMEMPRILAAPNPTEAVPEGAREPLYSRAKADDGAW